MSGLQDGRANAVAAFLDGEHFRFRRIPGAAARDGETGLSPAWSLRLEAPRTPLAERMTEDFARFCHQCFGVEFRGDAGARSVIVWKLRPPALPAEDFDRTDLSVEEHEIRIGPDRVEVAASHERGLLQGTHALEWMMADRGGPFLRHGATVRRPAFQPRISNGVFAEGRQTFENPGRFSDDYLGLMSHYGANGLHLAARLWDIFRSPSLPELDSPAFESRMEALRAFNRRTQRHGIDLYLQISTPPLDASHPVFEAHPDVRGARVEIFVDEISGRPWHNLCSGSARVHRAYGEAIAAVFHAVPQLAGAIVIVGGESFFHCFTRPADAANGETNCPHCRGRSASGEAARLANTAASAVKASGRHRTLFAWPYSAWIWSAKDPGEREWISRLSPDVSVLSNFDGYDEDGSTGAGVRLFDYNIKCIGPSSTFAAQAGCCRKKQRPIFAKVETCTTPDAFFLPYLPLHARWLARAAAMRKAGAAGFIGQWRFFGMNGSLPEELQYRSIWEDCGEHHLETVCRRDFQLEGDPVREALAAWKILSGAWDDFPYSAMTSGERAAYMRGPFYLGPAHPMIFNVQDSYNLPTAFRLLRGDIREMTDPREIEELQRRAKPRYVSDLLITLPFGVDRYLGLLAACREKWTAGSSRLRSVLEGRGLRARLELGVVDTMGSHLRTLENVVKFYRARDILQNTPGGREDFLERLDALRDLLDDEIANARNMLPLLEADPRLGFGYCYGPVYDAEMVRAKIRQCLHVRDVELPRFSSVVRFHIWLDSP